MNEVRYNEILRYEERKADIIRQFSDEKGVVREGFDNDLFISAILRIVDYFNYHLPNMQIGRTSIPDVEEFRNNSRNEYSISNFIFNRIEKNIKEVRIYDEVPPYKQNKKAIGGYNASTHTLEIYRNNFVEYVERMANGQSEEYKKNLAEAVFVHELLHAISDTNKPGQVGLRYIDRNGNKISVSINEGITESLAMDICSLKDVFFITQTESHQVSSNTLSSYKLETNIANLLKIADGDKFYLKYLVDASRMTISRNGQDVMKNVIDITNNHVPSRELEREKIEDYQRIQNILIKDIFDNKLQKGILDAVRNGQELDVKQFKKLRKDLYIIGECLIPSIKDVNPGEELNFNLAISHIRGMIDEGKIERTPNVEKYLLLVGAMREVERDFKIALTKRAS